MTNRTKRQITSWFVKVAFGAKRTNWQTVSLSLLCANRGWTHFSRRRC